MILVDSALARHVADGKAPIRVGMIGAGFMASGVLLQVSLAYRDSIRIVAVANRTVAKAVQAYAEAGEDDAVVCDSASALARAIEAGRPAVTEDPMLVATSPHVDIVLEVTGAVEEAIAPVVAAIEHGKHVALMNPELDGTLGPLLKHKADRAGVIFTDVDGDQPGVEGNLWRFVRGLGVRPVYHAVDTCAAEFAARTPYLYSTYDDETEVPQGATPKVIILGSGPNRIGQGIEFDYACVHASFALAAAGFETVMVNCNPETVSTDYDTSDRLYFEPLTLEDVLGVVELERPEGVIVQFGGQTPLRLAKFLEEAGVPLLGTPVDAIDLAEDRGRFGALLRRLEIKHPPYGTALSAEEAVAIANDTEFGLVAYLYTSDLKRGIRVCESLDTGMIGLNQGLVSNAGAPFGGVKMSGLGREGGTEGIEEYLETKYVGIKL